MESEQFLQQWSDTFAINVDGVMNMVRSLLPQLRRTPLGRIGQPADLVGPVLFLASNASAHVTGVVIPVDGGYLATGMMA